MLAGLGTGLTSYADMSRKDMEEEAASERAFGKAQALANLNAAMAKQQALDPDLRQARLDDAVALSETSSRVKREEQFAAAQRFEEAAKPIIQQMVADKGRPLTEMEKLKAVFETSRLTGEPVPGDYERGTQSILAAEAAVEARAVAAEKAARDRKDLFTLKQAELEAARAEGDRNRAAAAGGKAAEKAAEKAEKADIRTMAEIDKTFDGIIANKADTEIGRKLSEGMEKKFGVAWQAAAQADAFALVKASGGRLTAPEAVVAVIDGVKMDDGKGRLGYKLPDTEKTPGVFLHLQPLGRPAGGSVAPITGSSADKLAALGFGGTQPPRASAQPRQAPAVAPAPSRQPITAPIGLSPVGADQAAESIRSTLADFDRQIAALGTKNTKAAADEIQELLRKRQETAAVYEAYKRQVSERNTLTPRTIAEL